MNSVITTALAPAGGNNATVAEGRAAVSQAAPNRTTAAGLNAAGYGTGLPTNTGALAAGPHPLVQQNFVNPDAIVFGATTLAVRSRSDTVAGPTGQAFDTTVAFNLNTSAVVATNNLKVGLIDSAITGGAGFQSLVFTIRETGFADRIFTFSGTQMAGMQTLTDAQTFFRDNIIDLGPLPANANLQLSFQLTLTSLGGGDGFTGDLVFGVVPEPGTWVMLLVGGALLVLAVRSRRRGALKPCPARGRN